MKKGPFKPIVYKGKELQYYQLDSLEDTLYVIPQGEVSFTILSLYIHKDLPRMAAKEDDLLEKARKILIEQQGLRNDARSRVVNLLPKKRVFSLVYSEKKNDYFIWDISLHTVEPWRIVDYIKNPRNTTLKVNIKSTWKEIMDTRFLVLEKIRITEDATFYEEGLDLTSFLEENTEEDYHKLLEGLLLTTQEHKIKELYKELDAVEKSYSNKKKELLALLEAKKNKECFDYEKIKTLL